MLLMVTRFSDNLQICYASAVAFICRLAEGFVFPLQRASLTRYFTVGFFFFYYNFNFSVSLYLDQVIMW